MATGPVAPGVAAPPEQLLRRLEWQIARHLEGRNLGQHRSRFRGSGVDVTDIRAYEPYDDVRHIDWNVTARLDHPHVREYTEDREVNAWLLIDRSPSMTFGPIDRGKNVVLVEVAVALARLLTGDGNRVGALLFTSAIDEVIAPGTSRKHVLRLAHSLLAPSPSTGEATDLGALLRPAVALIRRRSLVFVASDFVTQPGWERPLAQLAARHDVVILRVTDPRDIALPDAGVVVVQDAETGEQLTVDTSNAAFRSNFRARALEHDRHVVSAAAKLGVAVHDVSTDDDLVTALTRITHRHAHHRANHREAHPR